MSYCDPMGLFPSVVLFTRAAQHHSGVISVICTVREQNLSLEAMPFCISGISVFVVYNFRACVFLNELVGLCLWCEGFLNMLLTCKIL